MGLPKHVPGLYRTVLREVKKTSMTPKTPNKDIVASFRTLFERYNGPKESHAALDRDAQVAAIFLRSQREHKVLLERYNPLIDLSAEDRIKATARRVGLDMPVTVKSES
ncbi:hypothetical protein HGRIS_009807 [Hohenbuehelia grisea]|uniref:Uncharacterized protein n=1 Tax=Hohenbuehelia grisea TaxID=104357 RepID=A0ABR3J2Q5_9AGAR